MTFKDWFRVDFLKLWLALALLLLLAVSFTIYVDSERQIGYANDQRHLSMMLADQLRQSSDDLTRMARTYVATQDPIYKKHYQSILDIRNGKTPQPDGYQYIYWDLILGDAEPPLAEGKQMIPLLEQMRQAGFAAGELHQLALAKGNSDALAVIEIEAMKLVESTEPDAAAKKAKANLMMNDATYHRHKALIMQPINQAYVLVNNRTADGVSTAKHYATVLRMVFIVCVVGALFMLWLVYGATVRYINERKQAEQALHKSEHSYRTMFDSAPEGVWMIGPDRRTTQVNQRMCDLLGYACEDLLGHNPVELADEENGKIFEEKARIVPNRQTRSYEVALRHRDGYNILTEFSATNLFNEDGSVMGVLAFVTDLTERKKAESQIQSLAFSDPLTGLPNRRLLMDRLRHALAASARHPRQGALLQIDLDDFRTLNDTLGHYKGDLLLQQVAKRLSACIREGDTVARYGGDEFVVLLEHLSENLQETATQAETVGEKILAALNHPYQLGNSMQRSTASIGITLFNGAQQESTEEPLKRAELAMYQAKAAGHNTLRFFDPQMQDAVTARAALETSLREAVLKNQFILHYQPQVTGSGQITGVEALVRWQDPKRGLVSPVEFIPLAEETGLILPLGHWVLEAACKQLALWASQPALAHLTVAVNVSARQFHHKDFVDQVLAVLDLTGANPQRLKLELTESLMLSNVEDVIAKMSALKGQGVGFSLDDFGTGYSSLSYLRRLPLDQLKIDISFVRDILTNQSDAAIAKTVIDLAENLGLAVIAEGVEIDGQRDLLDRQGCHAYQGYLFSRPLPLAEFEAFAKGARHPGR